jgi:hypothetical protein
MLWSTTSLSAINHAAGVSPRLAAIQFKTSSQRAQRTHRSRGEKAAEFRVATLAAQRTCTVPSVSMRSGTRGLTDKQIGRTLQSNGADQ